MLAPGTRLGPYEITAKLGEGGMGEVYRATDTKLKREVAIKVLPPDFGADSERLARFEREAHLLAQLQHPGIAAIFGLEESEGTLALVLELVEGPTLAERMESGALPVEESIGLARQIAEALEEAHEKGIVHRDLKPQNIKASLAGKVKVLDFGLAKAVDPQSGFSSAREMANSPTVTFGGTREGVILGTAAYMAPEQARGGSIDKRADIWAFGVVLYEMLAGERLFVEGSVVDTLSAVMRKPIDLDRLPPVVPRAVRRLVERCLERDPKRRLRDIGEARLVLEGAAVGGEEATRVASEPLVGSRSGWSARRGAAMALGAAVVGALLGAVIVSRLRPQRPGDPIRIHPLTYSGMDSDPSASPDGKLVAFTSHRDGRSRIWIRQIVGGGEAPLTEGPDGRARFSPDGASVLFVRDLGGNQAIYRISLVGGEPRRLLDNATAADWSPDGQRIVFARDRAGGAASFQLGVFDVTGGGERMLADLGKNLILAPRWSPDGRTIAFTTGSYSGADWEIRTIDVESGRMETVPSAEREPSMGGLAWSGTGESLFFVQSSSVMGDISGAGSRVLRADPKTGERQTLLWADGLSWTNSSSRQISQIDVLAPGRLLFDQRLRPQNLRESEIHGPDQAAGFRVLATGNTIDRQPVYSPDGRQILFSSNRGGNLDLWTIDRESGEIRQVTDGPEQDWDPAFTPDGKQIVWSSDRGTGHLEVWMANADGSGARQVSHDGFSAQNPNVTADGRWIVYWSGKPDATGMWKVHPDGSDSTLLIRTDPATVDVSPDGRYALYPDQDRLNLRNVLRVVEVENGAPVPFSIEVRYALGAPAIIWGRTRWAPDGRSIYFIGQNEQGLSGVFQQEFVPGRDTSATRRPVAGFASDLLTESFGISPDGSRIVLSTGRETASILIADGVPGAVPPVRKPS